MEQLLGKIRSFDLINKLQANMSSLSFGFPDKIWQTSRFTVPTNILIVCESGSNQSFPQCRYFVHWEKLWFWPDSHIQYANRESNTTRSLRKNSNVLSGHQCLNVTMTYWRFQKRNQVDMTIWNRGIVFIIDIIASIFLKRYLSYRKP